MNQRLKEILTEVWVTGGDIDFTKQVLNHSVSGRVVLAN